MYELKLYDFLQNQYSDMIKEGLLRLETNWDTKPKTIKMKSRNHKFYSVMIAQFCGGCTEIYVGETKLGTQKMILDFFKSARNMKMICRNTTALTVMRHYSPMYPMKLGLKPPKLAE